MMRELFFHIAIIMNSFQRYFFFSVIWSSKMQSILGKWTLPYFVSINHTGRIHVKESFIPSRFVGIDYRIWSWVVLLFLLASIAEPIELLLLLLLHQCSVHGSWHDGNDDKSREWEIVKLATAMVTRSLYNFTQIIGMKASERRRKKTQAENERIVVVNYVFACRVTHSEIETFSLKMCVRCARLSRALRVCCLSVFFFIEFLYHLTSFHSVSCALNTCDLSEIVRYVCC